MASDHCNSNVFGRFGALASEIVNLGSVAAGSSSGRASSKYESSPYAVVFDICKACKAAELRNRRRP